jgi:hypothetical protein
MSINQKQIQLVKDFNAQFGTDLGFESVSQLLGTKRVRGWYDEWSSKWAGIQGMPSHYKKIGLTDQEWVKYCKVSGERKQARRKAAHAIEKLSAQYKLAVKKENDILEKELSKTSTLTARILELKFDDLPLSDQVDIIQCDQKERKEKLSAIVAGYQKELFAISDEKERTQKFKSIFMA